MKFQDDIPSIPIDDFKDHYVLVFDLTSMQEVTDIFQNPELVGEPLRLELIFTQPFENVLNSLYWMNESRWLQLASLVLLERMCKNR